MPDTARVRDEVGSPRRTFVPREGASVVFRCEACEREIRDLRAVYLVHRGGWHIECAAHDDGAYAMDGGRAFGGGLQTLDLFAELAGAHWFDPADLFKAFLRLRAQASGLYVPPPARR